MGRVAGAPRDSGSAYCSPHKYQTPSRRPMKPSESLERRRQEHEEAKLLVQTVTSEASSCSESLCVTGKLSPEVGNEDT
ncbi:hypothetical protein NDU88_004578 [Pleurodeles waltl]|uniref:Uncharacterized protein n=1 Tax=Pleurodeles waltl TaxID=8319 RepID=A0AAV7NJU7_PLEWA|nr:hypothetical protein NDU88_004578 [Pleurodeles waltl]